MKAESSGSEERRYLEGPQPRGFEVLHALRIFREYFAGLRALHFVGPCVTVFGSARLGEDTPEYQLGRDVGRLLAHAGFGVVTGGGPGLMEAANRGASEAGGHSIGLNIELPTEQASNKYVDVALTFRHFFIRKVLLVKYSYGFIALPGGLGTLDELFEAATLIQTGKVDDFPIVLVGSSFWTPLVEWLRRELTELHTVDEADLESLHIVDTAKDAVSYLQEVAEKFGLRYHRLPRRWWMGEKRRA